MFESDRIIIRIIEQDDLEQARHLHNNWETLKWLTDVTHVSQAEQENWFTSLKVSQKNRRYSIIEKTNNRLIGIFRMDSLDLQNRNVEIGLDILPESRRLGYATETYNILLDYIFEDLGIIRVSLVSIESNLSALALYRKLGFQEEGIMRRAIFRNGTFYNTIMMSLLDSEWRAFKTNDYDIDRK